MSRASTAVPAATHLPEARPSGTAYVSPPITTFPTTNHPGPIAVGSDGNLWVGHETGIARITPLGAVTQFTGPTVGHPNSIAAGADGALWYAGASTVRRITTDGNATVINAGTPAWKLISGADGNLWFLTDAGIARLTPAGILTVFSDPALGQLYELAAGPDGNVWYTGVSGTGRVTPSGAISEVTNAASANITAGPDGNLWLGSPLRRVTPDGVLTEFLEFSGGDIAAGPDGNLWVLAYQQVRRIDPTTGIPSAPIPVWGNLQSLIAGSDGNLWITDSGANDTIRVSTSGTVTRFGGVSGPHHPTFGADGNLWFTNWDGGTIGRITPDGTYDRFSAPWSQLSSAVTPVYASMAVGSDGNLWVANYQQHSIDVVASTGAFVAHYPSSNLIYPVSLTAGPDGNVWFINRELNTIAKITPTGQFTLYWGPDIVRPWSITAGPDGNLWFTNEDHSIGRITPSGLTTRFPRTSVYPAYDIIAGSDGVLWFADPDGIGRITTTGTITHLGDLGLGYVRALSMGPDGSVWVAAGTSIAVLSPNGQRKVLTDPILENIVGITDGPGGNVWFTDHSRNSIGFVDPRFPAAPNGVHARAGDRSAGVAWTAPPANGGPPVTSYVVTASPGGQTCTWTSGPLVCTVTGLTNNQSYTFTVTGTNTLGPGMPSAQSAPVTAHSGSWFHALAPVRIADSRPESAVGPYTSPWDPGTTRTIPVAGQAGIPDDADAVTLNVTVTNTTAASFLTVWPTGQPQPIASSLNWTPGETSANQVTVPIGPDGTISIFNPSGTVDVILDETGYYDGAFGDGWVNVGPIRIADSRPESAVGPYTSPWDPGTIRTIPVGTFGGLTIDAVTLNVTVTNTTAASFLTVWPTGQPQPIASSLNWTPGETSANQVTVPIGPDGTISIFNPSGTVDVVVDVTGLYTLGFGFAFHPVAPSRVLDSRAESSIGGYTTPWEAGIEREVQIWGTGGIPDSAPAVMLNVTVTNTTAASFLTIWPTGNQRPLASNLNWPAGTTRANGTSIAVGFAGQISIFNPSGSVDVIADIAGYFG